MRKITFLFMFAILGLFSLNAQVLLFEDDFTDYANGSIPDGWTIYDEDGDGESWVVIQFQGHSKPVLVSDSWSGAVGPLTPDNFAVTPSIDLSDVDVDSAITLSWGIAGVDPDYSEENYTVYVATENNVDAFLDSDVYGQWSWWIG